MEKDLKEREIENFLKLVSEKGQTRMLTPVIVAQAKRLLEVYFNQTKIECVIYKPFTLTAEYQVDTTEEEDRKWEGAKEMEVFKQLGLEMMRKGAFEKEKIVNGNIETNRYKAKILIKEK